MVMDAMLSLYWNTFPWCRIGLEMVHFPSHTAGWPHGNEEGAGVHSEDVHGFSFQVVQSKLRQWTHEPQEDTVLSTPCVVILTFPSAACGFVLGPWRAHCTVFCTRFARLHHLVASPSTGFQRSVSNPFSLNTVAVHAFAVHPFWRNTYIASLLWIGGWGGEL